MVEFSNIDIAFYSVDNVTPFRQIVLFCICMYYSVDNITTLGEYVIDLYPVDEKSYDYLY